MTFSPSEAVRWTERLIGFAVGLQTLELLAVRAALRDEGVFAWPTLRQDFAGAPRVLRAALDAVLAYPRVLVLLGLQLVAALALGAGVAAGACAITLVATGIALSSRFRGPYNGGSDAMTMVVLLGLVLAHAVGGQLGCQLGLGYVAAQLVLSYFVAGAVKLGQPAWRDGSALAALLGAAQYAVPPAVAAQFGDRPLARAASWSVLAFECAFPLALLGPSACLVLMGVGASFHLVNARLLGLNRFLWAWLAAYPALWFWASQRG